MLRAIQNLSIKPQFILSDAFKIPGLTIPIKAIICGDRTVKSIAAASIVAKVSRDQYMIKMHELYPEYGFADHKGYGTKQHQRALKKFGPSPIHRMSYRPIKMFIKKSPQNESCEWRRELEAG
ncbi:ribonuclease HII [Candidatus Uhrbacteria bacterium]|nr:ribonuclease HII [Candidatus Uhrbacteria bacterium]